MPRPSPTAAPTPPERRRTREDPAVQREKILDASVNVFARLGYARAKIGDIAAEAEINRPLVYHYFASKEEILEAILLRAMSLVDPLVAELKTLDGSLEEQLRYLVRRFHELMADQPNLTRMLVDTASLPAASRSVEYEKRIALLRVSLLEWADRLSDEMRSDVDLEQFLLICISALTFWYAPTPTGRALGAGGDGSPAAIQRHTDALCDILLNGLRPAAGTPAARRRRRAARV